ncbi:MAG: glycosyltransferase family 4 protein [Candidatus Acidiferrum sp.]
MRIAVISPFLDRRHGTERCLIEQLERFPVAAGDEIHIYSQRVEDLHGVIRYKSGAPATTGQYLFWHRVPFIPGPHLVQYIFWFYANMVCRRWDAYKNGLKYALVYSPGINASDADAVAVHAIFSEFYPRLFARLRLRSSPASNWLRLLHRRLYYRLIIALEKKFYRQPGFSLAGVSALVSAQLARHFQRPDARVIHHGVDTQFFSVSRRLEQRPLVRQRFGLAPDAFVVLLIGNDFRNKGLDALLRALAELPDFDWKLLVVGDDVSSDHKNFVRDQAIADRIFFRPSSPDVLQFYAAADAYVGPSLEDAFGMPVLEAMACGLPIICSGRAGVSELVSHGSDGIILSDPQDAAEITSALRSLMSDPALCQRLGDRASATAREHSWDRNADAAWQWLREVARKKSGLRGDHG